MNHQQLQNLYAEFVLPTYKQIPLCLVKGKGSRVWDAEGKMYLDFFPGWGVSGLGHCHPAVVHAIKRQARTLLHLSNNFLNLKQAQLAQVIAGHSFPSRVFFANSGAEANEAALKFARRYGAPTGRFEIITMTKSFHGRTFGAMSATGQERIHEGFGPIVEGFRNAEFNDLESVKRLVTGKTVAVMLEPVQGEGGVNVATPEFFRGLRDLCDQNGMLLIADEVQTGMGRTGKMFAYQHYGLEPDLMTLAKALGAGVPIGALVVNRKIAREVLTPGTHGTTFGGSPLVAAAALAVFEAIQTEKLLANVSVMGEFLAQKMDRLKNKFPVIVQARGLGLMRAFELKEPGARVTEAAREKGLLINCTQENVLRIMPAITVNRSVIQRGMHLLEKAFQECYPGGKA